jgi:polyisoprenoid-binding protein YceI
MLKRVARALPLTILLLASALAADDYKIDPAHSSTSFAVKHMLVSTVRGRFADVNGTIHYDPADITKSWVTAVIKAQSITTDNERRDADLRSANFFDVANYPEIKFQSTRIEKRGDQYIAIGNLTIRDVTKQVELPFTVTAAEAGGKKRIGIDSSITLNRFDYHVSWDDPTHSVVSKEARIDLNLEAGAVPSGAAAAGSGK